MIIPIGETKILPHDNIFVLVTKQALPYFLPMVNRRAGEVEKIIIYGVNRASLELAKKLEEQRIGVTLIEPDKEKTQQAATALNKTTILQGNALDIDLW